MRYRILSVALIASVVLHFVALLALDGFLQIELQRTVQSQHVVRISARLQPSQPTQPPTPQQPNERTPEISSASTMGHAKRPNSSIGERRAAPESSLSPLTQRDDKIELERPSTPYYFTLRELTQRPILVSEVDIAAAVQPSPPLPGRMSARVLINDQGNVDRVVIEDSDLPAILEQAAIDAFMGAQYQPGEIEGRRVRSQIRIEITYDGPPQGGGLPLR